MRASTAYFAGAGTVIAAIVGGVGGGLLIADMVSPKSPKQGVEQTRLERRVRPEWIQAANAPTEAVPYLAATQASSATVAPTQSQTQASTAAQPQAESGNLNSRPSAPPGAGAAAQPQPAVREESSEDSAVKARDVDARRMGERRKAERRQQWAERRRHQQRQELELRAVEQRVREDTEPRREFVSDPVRGERPRILLFGEE